MTLSATEPTAQLDLSLCRQLVRIRVIEEMIADSYAEQEMRCPVHLSIGQEAAAVGVCSQLLPTDYVVSGHRSHGHYLAKGGNLKAMVAELYGRIDGCSRGKGGSMHLVDLSVGFLGATPIVGSTIAIGAGAAFASHLRNDNRITCVFFGEGAAEAGIFHETLNFAALHALPVIFICENNLYSISSPLSVRQPANREIYQLAAAHGMPAVPADGNDVGAVYAATKIAATRARQGLGPSFLELHTYRIREHCGPNFDLDLGFRPDGEFDYWKERDPVSVWTSKLVKRGDLSDDQIRQMETEATEEMASAVAFAKASPFPEPDELERDLFATSR
jgi:TPP-dependent pyruvate/acetoin dehydrogenase alpha subunit